MWTKGTLAAPDSLAIVEVIAALDQRLASHTIEDDPITEVALDTIGSLAGFVESTVG